ncbi:MAG: helix-turn-helix domain-containing protein, partial [Planctomycetes bacterium]|nr:helix-turn-helix domain-containing protein [Planctomycetota bacterium]
MVQGYYTLDEAAKILQMPPEKLSQLAQKREIRAFADRGTWRFRTQDIEEKARQLGLGSSPDLQLGERQPAPPPASGPKSSRKLTGTAAPEKSASPPPSAPTPEPSVFNFAQSGEDVDLGGAGAPGGSKASKGGLSPRPKPGSDSDIKLVPDGSDVDFRLPGHESGGQKTGASTGSSPEEDESPLPLTPPPKS